MQIIQPFQIPINWRMSKFEITGHKFFDTPKKLGDFENDLQFQFTTQQNLDTIENDHTINIQLTLNLFNDAKSEETLFQMSSYALYLITNYEESIAKVNAVPVDLLSEMIIAQAATVRGAYYLITRDTFLAGSIVPTLSKNLLITTFQQSNE